MEELRLDDALVPRSSWNTHLACLQRLCDAASRGLDTAALAGITGAGFRTALCRESTPPSLYHTWAWGPQFRCWLDALGIDAEVSEHRTYLRTFPAWLDRQHECIMDTLSRGFPVMYWDNLGFALILGADDAGYWLSGIPEQLVNPSWWGKATAAKLLARLQSTASAVEPKPFYCPRSEIEPMLDENAVFIYMHGVTRFDERQALLEGLYTCWAELSGMLEFPRVLDDIEYAYDPQYGVVAFERLREELRLTKVHPFGLMLSINSLAEARHFAAQYLSRILPLLDEELLPQVQQLMQFMTRSAEYLRSAQGLFRPPLREQEQFTRENLAQCRELLYQVQQTEETAIMVMKVVVRKMLELSK